MSEESELIDDGATVLRSITRGEYDAELEQILHAARERQRHIHLTAAWSMKPGDRVKVVRGRPQYLIGELATVQKVMQTWCIVKLDRDCGKFSADRAIRSPLSILEIVKP